MAFTIAGLSICHFIEVEFGSYHGRSSFFFVFLILEASFLWDGLWKHLTFCFLLHGMLVPVSLSISLQDTISVCLCPSLSPILFLNPKASLPQLWFVLFCFHFLLLFLSSYALKFLSYYSLDFWAIPCFIPFFVVLAFSPYGKSNCSPRRLVVPFLG